MVFSTMAELYQHVDEVIVPYTWRALHVLYIDLVRKRELYGIFLSEINSPTI